MFSAAVGSQRPRKMIDAQGLLIGFPTQKEQGNLMAEQGKDVGDAKKPSERLLRWERPRAGPCIWAAAA
jgi:hypothetical protein